MTPPEVHCHFLCLRAVELQVVQVTPGGNILDPYFSDTPDNGGVIRELLHMTQFGAVHDVCCVEEGGQYNPLGCSRATGHNVRCDGPQAAKLRSVGEVICDPSDKQWVHLHGGEFFL